ncbi:methyl-accepting chemotaxis protein [Vibrio ostreae]|uniref:Methyl-accepting chemotaxis protein n=1 Tax=Vibrio ostreae TaxID=2841925 RepID=A0A975UBU8_9VIBR|nr:methyl-accepting chemotaxis protein [Vibrio ostreae]QXO18910.1 methyl-accepting chemotaxis protein [Vibrio ostreae]
MSRNLRIGVRTSVAFGFLGLIILALGLFSVSQLSKLNTITDVLTEHRMPAIATVNDMRRDILLMQLRIAQLSDADTQQQMDKIVQDINSISANYDKSEQKMQQYSSSSESQAIYRNVVQLNDDFLATLPRLYELSVIGNMEPATDYREEVVSIAATVLKNAIDEYSRFQRERAEQENNSATENYQSSKVWMIGGIVASLVVMVLLAFFYTRSLVTPLRRAVTIAQTIATGDLTQRFSDDHRDEAADMMRALTDMQNQLKEAMSLISDSSQQLATTSEELSAVTKQSSSTIEQQSDQVNLAATAVSELTSAIDEVARSANSASNNAEVVDSKTQQGKVKIVETISTVDTLKNEIQLSEQSVIALADSIRQISSVLDVIRNIADQTNLLALNAAIEAARAGENGRGFAVVADEVRALAHRTQTSTKDIEVMIAEVGAETDKAVQNMHNSNEMASSTLNVANAAGAAFEEISSLISSINDQNATIASAAEEQSTVAREVDQNLVHIRDLSMQTSAGADQTSASSTELAKLAEHLNQLVKRFKF